MSFSAEWLALREPCDHASINPELRAALAARFGERTSIRVVDLGCGAGSNLRGTFAALPADQSWTLVDYDPQLLAAARARLADWADAAEGDGGAIRLRKDGRRMAVSFREADLAAGALDAVVGGADLVTAAALFDLVSVQRIEALADAVQRAGAVFHTVLTYDGFARWTPAQPLDGAILAAFNADQRTDKGFGPAAGPGATTALVRAFHARGYRVLRGTSPWVVDGRYGALRDELDRGFAAAAVKAGRVTPAEAEAWLAERREHADAVTIVGHEDLLALPG